MRLPFPNCLHDRTSSPAAPCWAASETRFGVKRRTLFPSCPILPPCTDGCNGARILSAHRASRLRTFVRFDSIHGYELRASIGDNDEWAWCYYVDRVCEATGADDVSSHEEITVLGKQTLLAMEGNWVLKWRSGDGRFWEQFDGVEMTIEWGCDGGTSAPWAVDAAGRCSVLELDDREVCLLAAWIRTGFWVTMEGRKQLRIRLVQNAVLGFDKAASATAFTMSVQLKDGKVVAYVAVDATTMLPLRAGIRAFGGWSKWEYFDWKPLVAGQRHLFPFSSVLVQASENKEAYLVRECSVKSCSDGVKTRSELLSSFSYSVPTLPVVPRPQANHSHLDVDPTCLPSVQMLRADSGHYLVQPLVNGKTIGYFIVDTGASNLIIAPQKVAMTVNLGKYDQRGNCQGKGARLINIWGDQYHWCKWRVEGQAVLKMVQVKSQYCRADTFQLGQLRITNPMFMEILVSGLVRGDPLVVGICGFDIFAGCIVEMAYDEGMMSLFHPSTYRLLHSESLQWHTLRLMESVPYVSATFNGHTARFLLDTGAGGVDVIFHKRAVEEFELLHSIHSETYAELTGIDASGKNLEVTLGILDHLTIAGRSFKQVKVMLARQNAGNLDTSEYVSGLLCGDLLMRCRIVFDYALRRFAVKHSSVPIQSSQ